MKIPISWARPMAEALQNALVETYVPADVYGAASDLFGKRSALVRWCLTPSPPLRGRTPLDACAAGRQNEVLELIGKMEHGAF